MCNSLDEQFVNLGQDVILGQQVHGTPLAVSWILLLVIVAILAFGFKGMRRLLSGAVAVLVVLAIFVVTVHSYRNLAYREDMVVQTIEERPASRIRIAQTGNSRRVSVVVDDTLTNSAAGAAGDAEIALSEEPTETTETAAAADAVESETENAAETPALAEPRPDWVDSPSTRIGHVERRVVAAGPYQTLQECERGLDLEILEATRQFVLEDFNAEQVSLDTLDEMGVTTAGVRRDICTDYYVETTHHDFGDMKTLYVLMEFNPSVRDDLGRRWQDYQRRANLVNVGLGGGGVLGLLALVYGLLKVDTWTKGYYTKRLFIGVPILVAVLLALLAMIPKRW